MKIYLLRHEERYQNPKFDTELTHQGKLNAIKLSKTLDKLNINIIISSPFVRTIQTIEHYVNEKNLKINIDYALNEAFIYKNLFDNTDIRRITNDMYGYNLINKNYYPVINANELSLNENYDKINYRTNKLISKLIKYKNLSNKNILLVSHMTTINSIIGKNYNYHYPTGGLMLYYDKRIVNEPINFIQI
jgi:broad specificity phosphatase PhoE